MSEKDQNLERIQKILEERAKLLARPLREESPGEVIEVAVVSLGLNQYGIDVKSIAEVQLFDGVTPIPGIPPYWIGLVNLRSQLVPLLDLGVYLGLPSFPKNEPAYKKEKTKNRKEKNDQGNNNPDNPCTVIYIHDNNHLIGLLVDQVIEIQKIPKTEITPSPIKKSMNERKTTEGITPGLSSILNMDGILADPKLIIQDIVTQ